MSHPLTVRFWRGWRGAFVIVASIALYVTSPFQLVPPRVWYFVGHVLSVASVPIMIWAIRTVIRWLQKQTSGGLSDDGPPTAR